MFWTILLFVITTGLLITIHELGHYWVARVCGLIPERFCIGFGPKLFTFNATAGTEFVIAAIPLGGYVKMSNSQRSTLVDRGSIVNFDRLSIVKRAAIIVAGPMANFFLAFLLYWLIFQFGVVSFPVTVEKTVPGSIASSLHIPTNATLVSIDDIKIERWQDVRLALVKSIGKNVISISYFCDDSSKTIKIIANIEDWRLNIDQDDPVGTFGFIPQQPKVIPVIATVLPNSPAEREGLLPGDRIIRVNNQSLKDWQIFTAQVKREKQLNLEIIRKNQHLLFTVVPEMKQKSVKQQEGFIGVVPRIDLPEIKYDFFSAALKSLQLISLVAKLTVRSFYLLITGSLDMGYLSGPIAVAKNAYDSASYGIVAYFYFLAFISINLGLVNLVPLPVLDGGHLLLLSVEKIKGQPLSKGKLTWIYNTSILLLVLLMVIVLLNDFSRT